jgi:hypothetical protein
MKAKNSNGKKPKARKRKVDQKAPKAANKNTKPKSNAAKAS